MESDGRAQGKMEERPRGGVSKVGVTWGLSWVEWVRWSEGVKWGELASIPDANKIYVCAFLAAPPFSGRVWHLMPHTSLAKARSNSS